MHFFQVVFKVPYKGMVTSTGSGDKLSRSLTDVTFKK